MTGWNEDGRYLRHTMLPSGLVFTIDETEFRTPIPSQAWMPPLMFEQFAPEKTPGELREEAAGKALAVFRELGVLGEPEGAQPRRRRLPRLPY